MKKLFGIFAALVLCFTLFSAAATAEGTVSFETSANIQSVKAADNVVFTLSIRNQSSQAKTVGSCQVVLLYDAARFETKATGTTPFKNSCYTTKGTTIDEEELSLNPTVGINTPGKISVAFAGSDSYTIAPGETMTLLRINLCVKETAAGGTTALAFDASGIYRIFDATGGNISGVTLGDAAAVTVEGAHIHDYGTPSWTWTGYSAATATFTCSCGDEQMATATITDAVTTLPTESETGIRTYTATVTFGGSIYTDTKVETIGKLQPASPYRITGITVRDGSGMEISSIPTAKCLVSVALENISADGTAMVMIAAYKENGQFDGLLYASFKGLNVGAEIELTVPLDNTDGTVKTLKAFTFKGFSDLTPLCDAVFFSKN